MELLTLAANDWVNSFDPAVHFFLVGMNPYVVTFFNPPWALFPLIPFALFPWGRELMFLVAILFFAFVAFRLHASPIGVVALALSPIGYGALIWGNIEWLILLGLVIEPLIGIPLLLLKPQMTICVVIFLIVEMIRNRETARLLQVGIVVSVLSIFGLLIYHHWFLQPFTYADRVGVINASFFPYSVPIGAWLFIQSLKTRQMPFAIAASPFFFPTLSETAWIVVLIAMVSSTPRIILASIGAWGAFLAIRFGYFRL